MKAYSTNGLKETPSVARNEAEKAPAMTARFLCHPRSYDHDSCLFTSDSTEGMDERVRAGNLNLEGRHPTS